MSSTSSGCGHASETGALCQPWSPFPHPYTPYDIQHQLMTRMYTAIKRKHVGVFESPTGTVSSAVFCSQAPKPSSNRPRCGCQQRRRMQGKTLSVICSALQWLREYQDNGSDDDEDQQPTLASLTSSARSIGSNINDGKCRQLARNHDDDASKRQRSSVGQPTKYDLAAAHNHCASQCFAEPDWCLNHEFEKAEREKASALERLRGIRGALSTRLERLRVVEREGHGLAAASGPKVSREQRRARAKQLQAAAKKRKREVGGADDAADIESAGRGRSGGKTNDDDDVLVPDEYHSDTSDDDDGDVGDAARQSSTTRKGTGKRRSKGSTSGDASDVVDRSSTGGSRTESIADRIRAELAAEQATIAASGGHLQHLRSSGTLKQATAEEEDEEAAAFRPKILFVSRTHSQIAQFIREVNKTKFGRDIRVVALGSRKNLCVHPDVSALASDSRINERCAELQDEKGKSTANSSSSNKASKSDSGTSIKAPASTSSSGGCPYVEPGRQDEYRDRLLAGLRDIEDAADLGWEMSTCAYYGSRKAVKYADVVAMPYTTLLHAGTRESSGINVAGCVVIIDEGHNILEAITSAHATSVTHQQLTAAHATVCAYLDKYRSRMKGSNVAYCTQLAATIAALATYLRDPNLPITPVPPTSATEAALEADRSAAAAAAAVAASAVVADSKLLTAATAGVSGSKSAPAPVTDAAHGVSPPGSSPGSNPPAPSSSSSSSSPSSSLVPGGGVPGGGAGAPTSSSALNAAPQPPRPVSAPPSRSASPTATSSIGGLSFWGKSVAKPTATLAVGAVSLSASASIAAPAALASATTRPAGVGESAFAAAPSAKLTASLVSVAVTAAPPASAPLQPDLVVPPAQAVITSEHPAPTDARAPSPAASSATSTSPPPPPPPSSAPTAVPQTPSPSSSLHTVSDFLSRCGLGAVNLFKLKKYVDTVQLMRKLRGFAEAGSAHSANACGEAGDVGIHALHRGAAPGRSTSAAGQKSGSSGAAAAPAATVSSRHSSGYMASVAGMQAAYAFLCSLTSADGDGRVVIHRESNGSGGGGGGGAAGYKAASAMSTSSAFRSAAKPASSSAAPSSSASTAASVDTFSYKFVLLNPAVPFTSIVNLARSVILVGGTMQPMDDIVDCLFGHLPRQRVDTFTCGHIIPSSNLCAMSIPRGPTGVTFDFRHGSRSNPAVIEELGRVILNVAALVPTGAVVFVCSYDYLRQILAAWSRAPKPAASGNGGISNGSNAGGYGASSRSLAMVAAAVGALPGAIQPGEPGSILHQLSKRKRLFSEPRDAGQVEAVLRAYTAAATAVTGDVVMKPKDADSEQEDDDEDGDGASANGDAMSIGGSVTRFGNANAAFGFNGLGLLQGPAYPGGGGSSGSVRDGRWTSGPGSIASNDTGHSAPPRLGVSSAAATAAGPRGAILFCVVGGKMSEGINFSDDLARCVVIAGLPYPNPSDPELKERMAYLDRKKQTGMQTIGVGPGRHQALPASSSSTASASSSSSSSASSGRDWYENTTMRAVNQAIGRSIRHGGDWASILLLDSRYCTPRVKSKLPGWIGDRVTEGGAWGGVMAGLGAFFRGKREAAAAAAVATRGTAAAGDGAGAAAAVGAAVGR